MHLKVRSAIMALAVVVSLGIVVVAAIGVYQFRTIGVGGTVYSKIVMTKDLLADILPPPEYIIEAYLEASLAESGVKTPAEVKTRLVALRKDYDDRRAFWQKVTDLPKSLLDKLVVNSNEHAQAFWTAVETGLIPALERKDKTASAAAYRAATDAYTKHRAVIDEIVQQANNLNTAIETETQGTIQFTAVIMGSALLALLALLGAGIMTISRKVIGPVLTITNVLSEIAKGNYDIEVPATARKDEIGVMANAALTLRDNLAESARRQAQATERDREAMAQKEKHAAEMGEQAEQQRAAAEQQRIAAEREAKSAAMMTEFSAEVADIVKLAVNGDFSRRIPVDGKDGVVLNLSQSLNAMCENFRTALTDVATMMNSLAKGDLTQRITADYQGMFDELKTNANDTAEQLSLIVSDINAAVNEVSNASSEVSTSTVDLSQRTEEQAAGLEQTAASMEEMSATVKKNAENARHANELTIGTRTAAEQGGKVATNAMQAMTRIEESSAKIADIIGVIDEIARQTNLLALNAAVEAARAGDAGRGFAVVASEVRSLAQRSSQAAKDIKDLITNSNGEVKEGVSLVNSAGTSLSEIMESVKSVAEIVADIATASAEQATGLDQVNTALTQIDEMTQQNSALVEENAATAKTLEQQATAMKQRVAFFNLGDNAAPAKAETKTAAPTAKSDRTQKAEPAKAEPRRTARAAPPVQGNLAVKADDWEEF